MIKYAINALAIVFVIYTLADVFGFDGIKNFMIFFWSNCIFRNIYLIFKSTVKLHLNKIVICSIM
jgi:hypothetical protein